VIERSHAMHFLPLRLEPGSDLRRSLEETALREGHASCFVVSGIGSLRGATLRLAGDEAQTVLIGMFEIISLSGTISEDGAHLHMAIANSEGQVVGGHVCHGNQVRTTAEVLLASLSEWKLKREFDATTGFNELICRPKIQDRA
jgi:predicted DNA-binding protein with PD1-like motif